MAHAVVEWTANLEGEADIHGLLELIAAAMRDSGGVFPWGGIRVRAIRLDDYVIADGKADDAFVNITVKMGAGRSAEFKREFFSALFEKIKSALRGALCQTVSGAVALCRGSRRKRQFQAQQYPPALQAGSLMPLSRRHRRRTGRAPGQGGRKRVSRSAIFPANIPDDDRGWLSRAARPG